MLRIIAILGTIVASAVAQVSIAGPSASIKPGQTAVLTINITGAAGIAATEGTISLPAGWTGTCAIAPVQATSKTVYCSVTPAGLLTYVVSGMTVTPLADGALITVNVLVPGNTAPGTVVIPLADPLGSSLAGDPVAMTVTGPPFSLSIGSACDLNNDGSVNQQDIDAAVAARLANPPANPPSMDLNSDNKVNVVDIYRIGVAAGGGACRVG